MYENVVDVLVLNSFCRPIIISYSNLEHIKKSQNNCQIRTNMFNKKSLNRFPFKVKKLFFAEGNLTSITF